VFTQLETFGRSGGTVGRPCHNTCIAFMVMLFGALALLTSPGCTRASGDVGADREAAKEIREKLLAKAADAGDAATTVTDAGPAGFTALKGQFVLGAGTVDIKLLDVNSRPDDRHACAPGGQVPRDNSLIVDDATRGIADIVIFARKTKHKHESALKPEQSEVVFDQKQCLFLSPAFVAQVGQTIQVKNSDPVGHNTNIQGTGFNQIIPVNQSTSFEVKSQVETAREVGCNVHPWMKAYMWFRKDGYFAVTNKDGTFTIENLPAGELIEFQVWHARATTGLALTVPELKWDAKGRFRVTLEPDSPKDLGKLEVPAGALTGS
jgi:plastocyanin